MTSYCTRPSDLCNFDRLWKTHSKFELSKLHSELYYYLYLPIPNILNRSRPTCLAVLYVRLLALIISLTSSQFGV
jgi:hypothetical protein